MSGTTSGVEFTQVGDATNMRIYQGKTLNFDVIWGGSNPIDISGYQAVFQARSIDGDVMLDLNVGNGGIVIDGLAGKISFSATPLQTAGIKKAGRFEVEMTTTSNDIYRVISGNISPIEEVAL